MGVPSRLFVFAVVVGTAAACVRPPAPASGTAAPPTTPAPSVDPCALVTKAEAEHVLEVQIAEPSARANGNTCDYQAPGLFQKVPGTTPANGNEQLAADLKKRASVQVYAPAPNENAARQQFESTKPRTGHPSAAVANLGNAAACADVTPNLARLSVLIGNRVIVVSAPTCKQATALGRAALGRV